MHMEQYNTLYNTSTRVLDFQCLPFLVVPVKFSFVWQDQIGTVGGDIEKSSSSVAHEAGAEILNVVS